MPQADIVVMGGGLAGLVAGVRARELGLSVIVLEASPYPFYFCDSRISAGNIHFMGVSPKADPDALVAHVMQRTGGGANERVVRAFAGNARRAIDWLAAHGAQYRPGGFWLAPGPRRGPGLDWEDRGPDRLLQQLTEELLRKGGHLVLGAHCDRLVTNTGRIVGVSATWDEEPVLYYGNVLLADGGFQGNPALIERFITPRPASLLLANSKAALGTGVMMAQAAGAALSDMRYFQGHLYSRDAFELPDLWPHPTLDAVAAEGIIVDSRGVRYMDEGRGGAFMANQLARSDDPLGCWAVFDSEVWTTGAARGRSAGEEDPDAVNPDLPDRGGTVLEAGSIAELAAKTGVRAESLGRTLHDYNSALASGSLPGLSRPRTNGAGSARPVQTPPFYAIPLAAGIVKTMGGPLTDEHCRVLRPDGSAIAGLYAIGATMGGLEGGEAVGNFGGLAQALIGGLLASEHVASTKATS